MKQLTQASRPLLVEAWQGRTFFDAAPIADPRRAYMDHLAQAWKTTRERIEDQDDDEDEQADDDPRAAYIHRQQDAWKTSHP